MRSEQVQRASDENNVGPNYFVLFRSFFVLFLFLFFFFLLFLLVLLF